MATGDKLYIADKATLDEVNLKLDTLDTKISDRGIPYYTLSDISSKLKLGSVNIISNSTTPRISQTGSGIIYGIVYVGASASYPSTITNDLQIYIDGSLFYRSSSSGDSSTTILPTGIITRYILAGNLVIAPNGTTLPLEGRQTTSYPASATIGYYYTPKPIRFNSSLTIVASVNPTSSLLSNGTLYYYYELD